MKTTTNDPKILLLLGFILFASWPTSSAEEFGLSNEFDFGQIDSLDSLGNNIELAYDDSIMQNQDVVVPQIDPGPIDSLDSLGNNIELAYDDSIMQNQDEAVLQIDPGTDNLKKAVALENGFDFNRINSINSLDTNVVEAYGDGTMGVFKKMNTGIYRDEDSLDKLRDITLFTFGSDTLKIYDSSSFVVQDELGHLLSQNFVRSSNLDLQGIPVAVIKEDLVSLPNNGGFIPTTQTTILLPDVLDAYQTQALTSQLASAFGESDLGGVTLKAFKYNDEDVLSSLRLDLGGEIPWDEISKVFNDPMFKQALSEAIEQYKEKQENPYDEVWARGYMDSYGGIICHWGYDNGV